MAGMTRAATPLLALPADASDALIARHPLLFRGWLGADATLVPFERSFGCSRHWLPVLEVACDALEDGLEAELSRGACLHRLPAPYRVHERFGELRMELLYGTSWSDRILECLAHQSRHICPGCGAMALSPVLRLHGTCRCAPEGR